MKIKKRLRADDDSQAKQVVPFTKKISDRENELEKLLCERDKQLSECLTRFDESSKKLCVRETQLQDCFQFMTESLICLRPVVLSLNKSFEKNSEFTLHHKYKKFLEIFSTEKFLEELCALKTLPSDGKLILRLFQCNSFSARMVVALHLDSSKDDDKVICIQTYFLFLFSIICSHLFFFFFFRLLASHCEAADTALHFFKSICF